MPNKTEDTLRYRRDEKAQGRLMTAQERLKLIEPYLPERPEARDGRTKQRRKPMLGVRRFIANQLYLFVYTLIHVVFSFYLRMRQVYHFLEIRTRAILSYHHRTPEIIEGDVRALKRLPRHLSVILRSEEDSGRAGAELERLVNEVADIAAWCACAGIPKLSIYEKTGILKSYLPQTHRAISQKLAAYYGGSHPALTLKAPHAPSIESDPDVNGDDDSKHLTVLLLSAEDGRESLVDLTRIFTEMSQKQKISPADINIELIDGELSAGVMDEPDLLIIFGPYVELSGYPPWQIRLTEIYHVQDNNTVGYQVFLRGLKNFAGAQFRRGK